MITKIVVYKFNSLSRDEVNVMLGIELEQTRVYQDAKAEGESIGEARGETRMLMRLINCRFGAVDAQITARLQQLNVSQLEELGEALLDFTSLADLEQFLDC
jgi:predicted transposase YdaD